MNNANFTLKDLFNIVKAMNECIDYDEELIRVGCNISTQIRDTVAPNNVTLKIIEYEIFHILLNHILRQGCKISFFYRNNKERRSCQMQFIHKNICADDVEHDVNIYYDKDSVLLLDLARIIAKHINVTINVKSKINVNYVWEMLNDVREYKRIC